MYDAGEEGASLSCKKLDNYKTMNSLSRKYPLVVLSPFKDFKSNTSNGDFTKADSNYQKNQKHQKTSPEIFRLLTEEANLKWELLKRKKLNKPPLPPQQLEAPVFDLNIQNGHRMEGVTSAQLLNSPNRAKLRMSVTDLSISEQQKAMVVSEKSKNTSNTRASSRSNRGYTTKYLDILLPQKSQKSNVDITYQSDNVSTCKKSSQNCQDQLARRLISNSKYNIQQQAKLHSRPSNTIKQNYVTGKLDSEFIFTPKVKSSNETHNSYSVTHFSLDTNTDLHTNQIFRKEESNIQSVIRKQIPTSQLKKNSSDRLDIDGYSEVSSDEDTYTQIESGMVGVYLEASYPQLPPLCSLCCSAGTEELIYCSICCDCYHQCCVGMEFDRSGVENWVCSSCTSCGVCGKGRETEMIHQCCECLAYYHMGCLGIHLPLPLTEEGANNWPCPRCVLCKGCSTQRPEKFPEECSVKLFCKRCVLLRKKGNFCPVCDKVYEDNNWNCRMIECDKCSSWLHDSCESLSDEDYQLLGELPRSIPYTCSVCQRMSADSSRTVKWRIAVEENRNKRIQSIMDQLKSQQMLKTLLTNLETAPNGMRSLHSTLIVVISNVDNWTYPTVAAFCKDFMMVMHQIFKLVDKHSLLHRYTFSLQTVFIKLICQEFPWFIIPPSDDSVIHSRVLKQEKKRKIPNSRNCDYFPSSHFFNPTDSSLLFPSYKFDHKYTKSNSDTNSPIKRTKLSHNYFSTPSKQKPTDRRQCILCKDIGDSVGEKEGRLLPCGINEWVHINCAIWSSDVYTRGSCIKNIQTAVRTGLRSYCNVCNSVGATVGCYNKKCLLTVHYKCAISDNWVFLKNMKVFCPQHGNSFEPKSVCTQKDFLIDEFLYVETLPSQNQRLRNLNKLPGPRKLNVVSGCVRVYSLGSIVPSSDTRDAIYPVNFRSSRLFWSSRKPSVLSTYTCFVKEYIPEDPVTHPDINYTIPHDCRSDTIQSMTLPNPNLLYSNEQQDGTISPVSKILPVNSNQITVVEEDSNSIDPSSDLNLGLEVCHPEHPVSRGLFEQTFPFFKQTDTSDVQFQRVNSNPKVNGNKLLSLSNEDFYLTQHQNRLYNYELGCSDNFLEQQQQQQQQQNMMTHETRLKFIIVCSDGFTTQSDSLQGAWDNVIIELTRGRELHNMPPLSFQATSPQDMFGFTLHSVSREIEQLEDADKCSLYQFKFHPPAKREDLTDLDFVCENPFGAARCISFTTKSNPGMFSFFYSKHRLPPPQLDIQKLTSVLNEDDLYPELQCHTPQLFENGTLPFIRYRQMIKNLPNTVRVFRSKIQGLGIFAMRDIEVGDMIIEYTGQVIRPFMCDIKEALYESKGIGCYMFKIDQNQVVDGTMSGNASRFINHSCQPNCASKIVIIELKKRILIFARRKILMGEELTYDYKFPIEDIKIPCLCKSKKCRNFMN